MKVFMKFGLTLIVIISCFSGNLKSAKAEHNHWTEADSSLYKNIRPRPLLRSTDIQGISIVVPDDLEWKKLGDRLKEAIDAKTTNKAVVAVADPAKFSDGWAGNIILLGNLGNNKQVARLYGLRFSYADAVYPGKNGYQLLTLIDPFGRGGNTVVISASDLEGARAGVDRLSVVVKDQNDAMIPWQFEASLSEPTSAYFKRTSKVSTEEEKRLDARANALLKVVKPIEGSEVIADALLAVISELKTYSEYYLLTANPAYGKMYKDLILGYARFVNTHSSAALSQLNERRNMWIQGEKVIQNWTVLEASPIFSDSDRTEIISALYLTCEANAEDRYLVIAPEKAPRWNHEIFPAMALVGSSFYFEKYYKMPEVQAWMNTGNRIFRGNTSYISMDEGSDYLSHLPMVNIDYAMATGNLQYIDKRLRPSADLHSMMIDNLGTLSGGGDTYPFGMSSAYSWGHSQVLNAASWYYGDPVYNFLLQRTQNGPFPGQKMPDLNYPIHRYIVNLDSPKTLTDGRPKVQAQQIEPGVYDELKRLEKGTLNVEQKDTFHKLTFRSGFDTSDSYLILDGFSAGKHGHQDGNAILNYSANGRLFLNDRDYIQNTPEYHTGLVVVKDGEQQKKPSLVKLDWVGDINGTSLSRSTVPSYNGTEWDRTIISPDGKFFIIYDDVKFNEPGSYLLKNLWQSMGNVKIQQNTFNVDQKGAAMKIESLTDASLRSKEIYGHFIKYWKTVYPYPYADNENVLTELIDEKKYDAGEKASFINILSSHTNETTAWQSRRLNEGTVEIAKGTEKWLATKGIIKHEAFQSNGSFHLLGKAELLSAGVTDIKFRSAALHFPAPVFFRIDINQGKWKTYSLNKNKLRYNDAGQPVFEAALDSGEVDMGPLSSIKFVDILIRNSKQLVPSPKSSDAALPYQGERLYSFNEIVTSSASGDLNGDKTDEILLGGITGKVQAISPAGNLIWTFNARGRVNEVSVQRAGNEPLVFIATESWYMHVLNAEGKELWNYKFNDDQTHKEYKGNLIGITNIRLANANGKDKEPVVMVGTQFRYIYELDLKGKLLSDTLLYFYGIEDMEFADLDGDGKDEGVFALEYYYYALRKGKKEIQGKVGGPGFKIADVIKANSQDALPSVLLGSKQSEVRLIRFKDKIQELWVKNVGGEVNDIRHGDYDKDGKNEILVGTEGFQFYVLDQRGKVVFRKTLSDRVLKVEGFAKSSKPYYAAAMAGGKLSVLSASGEIIHTSQFNSEIANILSPLGGSEPVIVLTSGDLYQIK